MLAYSISSHVRFAPFTLPVILPSLKAAGIPPERIVVCVCGARGDREVKTPLGMLSFRQHESKVYAAFIEALARGPIVDWWFMLQDTCRAGPQFAQLAEQIDESKDAIGAGRAAWDPKKCIAELGAYRYSHLEAQREYVMSLLDIGLNRTDPDPNEGGLYSLTDKRGFYGAGKFLRDTEPRDIYGAGTLRQELYFPALDLWKYQSNWGQERPKWVNQHDTP